MDHRPDVVDQQDVHACEAQPMEARFERTQDTVMAIVVGCAKRHWRQKAIAFGIVGDRRVGREQAADLGRDDHFRTRAQRVADPTLAQTAAIMRCSVEIAHARVERRIDRRMGGRVIDAVEEVPDGAAAETDGAVVG